MYLLQYIRGMKFEVLENLITINLKQVRKNSLFNENSGFLIILYYLKTTHDLQFFIFFHI